MHQSLKMMKKCEELDIEMEIYGKPISFTMD
jgi:hypothetical protein